MDSAKKLMMFGSLLRTTCSSDSMLMAARCYSRTHYEVLGVEKGCSAKEIRDAYVALSKKFHPDLLPGGQGEFVRVNQAYEVLRRRQSRSLYDAQLSRPTAAPPDGQTWHQHGDVHTTNPHARVFHDDTLWGMRDRAEDGTHRGKPYYGIRGLKRLSNGPIGFFCLVFMLVGVLLHVLAIRSSHELATQYIEEKNQRLHAAYTAAKSKAIDPKDRDKIKEFLNSLKADSAD